MVVGLDEFVRRSLAFLQSSRCLQRCLVDQTSQPIGSDARHCRLTIRKRFQGPDACRLEQLAVQRPDPRYVDQRVFGAPALSAYVEELAERAVAAGLRDGGSFGRLLG